MKIVAERGDPRFAMVYVAQVGKNPDALIEFVDAVDPRYLKNKKWVIIVSTQIGCPVKCVMCDSGTYFLGNLTKEEIFAQIDYVLGNCNIDVRAHPKLKIQFARMGEPALNTAVLDVLEEMPGKYGINGLIPCIATTAPREAGGWFERLSVIKKKYFNGGKFQLQFSLNSTDEVVRDRMMPIKKWGLADIARFGEDFYSKKDRKIVLNFAMGSCVPLDIHVLQHHFSTEKFIIKITPVNPTANAVSNKIGTFVSPANESGADELVKKLEAVGFDVIVSIGSVEEIEIGSNCGQSARRILYNRHNQDGTTLQRGAGL